MLESINNVLNLLIEAIKQLLSDPLHHAIRASWWLVSFAAALWLVTFTLNFALTILGF
jgi:hypothetical protein